MRLFKNFDYWIPLCLFVVSCLSLAIVGSLSPKLFPHQALSLLIGFILFFLFAKIDLRIFESVPYLLYLGSIFLLFVTFFFGQVSRGAMRWLQVGPFGLQPSEIVKPFLVLFFAYFLTRPHSLRPTRIFLAFLFFSLPFILIFKQPDLGSSLVVLSSFLGILLGSQVSLSYILGLGVIAGVFLPLGWLFLADYQKIRILTFLNPQLDPLGGGYNLLQAVITVGSGKLFGRGLGKGTQSHFAFLPEYQTDFIFASLVEELGFIGGLLLLFFYSFLLYRILKVAQNANSPYAKLICLGIFSMLCFQIFINVGMNMGIAPITGITLPFVSLGGSSTVSLMIGLGLVEAAASSGKLTRTLEIR